METNPNKEISFSVQVAMDNQTIMLVENNSDEEKICILIFDLYTLEKVTEMQVNICSDVLEDTPDYNEYNDQYYPEGASTCKTSGAIPRVSCWNQGKYVLVGVGAKPFSRIFYEFRTYDTDSGAIVGTFNRMAHDETTGNLIDVEFHKDNPDKLIFIISEGVYGYNIIEADMIHNSVKTISNIISNDLKSIKVAEDLSVLYILTSALNYQTYQYSQALYTISYGSDIDLTTSNKKPVKALGSYVSNSQILNNSLLVYYEKMDGTVAISLFDGDNEIMYVEPTFEYAIYAHSFTYVDYNKEIFMMTNYYGSGCTFYQFSEKSDENQILMSVKEETYDVFDNQLYVSVKGGKEVIVYDTTKLRWAYLKFNAPVVYVEKVFEDYSSSLSFWFLLDLGNHYTTGKFMKQYNYYSYNSTPDVWDITYYQHFIKKELLPNETLTRVMPRLNFKRKGENENLTGVMLQFENNLIIYSADYDHVVIKKKWSYSPDEIISVGTGLGVLFYKKDQKKLFYYSYPLCIDDKAEAKVVYESPDLIQGLYCKLINNYGAHDIYIADEAKYVKRGGLIIDAEKQKYGKLVHTKLK